MSDLLSEFKNNALQWHQHRMMMLLMLLMLMKLAMVSCIRARHELYVLYAQWLIGVIISRRDDRENRHVQFRRRSGPSGPKLNNWNGKTSVTGGAHWSIGGVIQTDTVSVRLTVSCRVHARQSVHWAAFVCEQCYADISGSLVSLVSLLTLLPPTVNALNNLCRSHRSDQMNEQTTSPQW